MCTLGTHNTPGGDGGGGLGNAPCPLPAGDTPGQEQAGNWFCFATGASPRRARPLRSGGIVIVACDTCHGAVGLRRARFGNRAAAGKSLWSQKPNSGECVRVCRATGWLAYCRAPNGSGNDCVSVLVVHFAALPALQWNAPEPVAVRAGGSDSAASRGREGNVTAWPLLQQAEFRGRVMGLEAVEGGKK
eukprot:gene24632-biopygen8955